MLIFGVVLGFYSSICAYSNLAVEGITPPGSLQCSIVGIAFPVLGVSELNIIITSAMIAFVFSIISVGFGRLLRHCNEYS